MKRAVILTGHFLHQHRRPSMLWISQALRDMGWHVTLVTVGYSWISLVLGDRRLAALPYPPRTGVQQADPSLITVFGYSPVHPISARNPRVDAALAPLHRLFMTYWAPRLRPHLAKADLVIAESGAAVMLAPVLRRHAGAAKLIYRVNDDLSLLRAPGFLLRAERDHASLFDRISTASPHLARRFVHENVTIDPMGIPHADLNIGNPDPYMPRRAHEAVCAGTTLIDMTALGDIAQRRPNWRIHVIGRLKPPGPVPSNLILHGERSFYETVDFIAHADIGLAPYVDAPGIEYQTHNSNRILLYRHFGLPILGPDRLCHPSAPSIIGIATPDALQRAETWTNRPEPMPDWSELAQRLAQNGEIEPPLDVSRLPFSA